jgi:hypothetical protein
VQTDEAGQFAILQAPVGFVKLLVDGSTAALPGQYPSLEYDLVTVAGQNTTVGMPIYLLPLNTANQLCVTPTTGGGTLTIPEAPGFSLTFGPGQVTFPGGSKTGCVSVTVVHGDRVPMVPGFGQQPRFIVTIQPAGAVFNPPAPITLPNVDGLPPRAVTELYSFDHDIGTFVAVGTGTVSNDGQVIRSDPGVGVLKAGWHCGGNPNAIGTVAKCPDCYSCQGPPIGKPGGSCEPIPELSGPNFLEFCTQNLDNAVCCAAGDLCVQAARDAEINIFGGSRGCGPGNAFRHALATCCVSQRAGITCAVDLGKAFEVEQFNQPGWQGCQDTRADLHNNTIGALQGPFAQQPEDCVQLVLDALNRGDLQITPCP